MRKRTKIVLALIIIIIAVVAIIIKFTALNKNLIKIQTGSKYDNQLQIAEDKTKFKLGEEVYYSANSDSKMKKNASITINIKNESTKESVEKENLEIKSGAKFVRPINPIQINKKGKYKIEVIDGNRVLAKKVIEID